MMKKLLASILILSFVTPAWAGDLTCKQLEDNISEAQTKINNAKAGHNKKVSDYVAQINYFNGVIETMNLVVQSRKEHKKNPAAFMDTIFDEKDPLKNPAHQARLAAIYNECGDIAKEKECTDKLFALKKSDIWDLEIRRDELKATLELVKTEDLGIGSLVRLSENYAKEYAKKRCYEKTLEAPVTGDHTGDDCPVVNSENTSKINNLGSDVMDVVLSSNNTELGDGGLEKERKKLCKDLAGTEYSLAGCVPEDNQCAHYGKNYALDKGTCVKCTGATKHIYQSTCYTCPKDHDVVNGQCMKNCTSLEFRQDVAPFACIPDTAAEKEKNLRKQRSKEAWGKVLRTAAYVAIGAGAVVGLAFAFKAIFKDYFNRTEYITQNYNTYTGDVYSYDYNFKKGSTMYGGATNYNSSTSSNPNYNYYNSGAGYGMGNMNGMGYNSYFSSPSYYNPYGSSPYGWY